MNQPIANHLNFCRYRQDLERQVEETKARRQYEDMNETEFRLNSDLVKKLEADKKLVRTNLFDLKYEGKVQI